MEKEGLYVAKRKQVKKKNNIGCSFIWLIILVLLFGSKTNSKEPSQSPDIQATVPQTTVSTRLKNSPTVLVSLSATPSQKPTMSPTPAPTEQSTPTPIPEFTYIYNKNTKKFHYEWCNSVEDIKEKNKGTFTGTSEQMEKKGYQPCKRCNP